MSRHDQLVFLNNFRHAQAVTQKSRRWGRGGGRREAVGLMTSYSVTEQTNIFLAEPPRVSYLEDLENNGPPPSADKLANIQLLKPGDFMIG